jgi:hypothetical protein
LIFLQQDACNIPFINKAASGRNSITLSNVAGLVPVQAALGLLRVEEAHGVHIGPELRHLIDEHNLAELFSIRYI